MTKELSAMLDGELERQEFVAVMQACRGNSQMRQTWCEYHVIGAALRGEASVSASFTARVMERLQQEPVLLAPASRAAEANDISPNSGQLENTQAGVAGSADKEIQVSNVASIDARRAALKAESEQAMHQAKNRRPAYWGRSIMALAASAAGVAVVAWTALGPMQSADGPQQVAQLAQVAQLVQPVAPASVQALSAAAPELREYLLAHQVNAPGLYMQGGAQHIRTVAAVGK